ncbi:MAG: TlpA family protein disulfide reductase [Gammaproteobacteria bacterium]|nr:MAG: TlpA family protein disulfide reductase [Gammaproteobacteria bacterium]
MLKLKKYFLFLFLVSIFPSCSEPDYELFNGPSGYLEDLKGKWLVVNYWADWCPPCIKEMPELEEFLNENEEKVNVLAYNFDGLEGEDLQEQIIRFKVNIPSILTDPSDLFGWERPPSLPATYIVDPSGVTKEVLIGAQTRLSLEEAIAKYK